MKEIFDLKADVVTKGDNLREISPITDKTRVDENGVTHYVFSKSMFNNPWYVIPEDDLELFKKFMDGGSRSYPSDGNIPCDIVAGEARYIVNQIIDIAHDPEQRHHQEAQKTMKNRKYDLVRGTMKLYFGKYTSRDWRRKRYTDDIDFWIYEVNLLEHILKRSGWTKNKITREWEKKVKWVNFFTNKKNESILIAANDTNQLLDFGAGSYLEGSGLKEIFSKKIKRGHDVDLSDIINVVMVNGGKEIFNREEWRESWNSFEQAANTRSTRITSNIITLFRHALAIADYVERVARALFKYQHLIMDKSMYPDRHLNDICKASVHWMSYLSSYGPDATRMLIHDFLIKQAREKVGHSKNLLTFTKKLIDLLNSKYKHLKVIFEIERPEFKLITKEACPKSKALKDWLSDKDVDWQEIDYLDPTIDLSGLDEEILLKLNYSEEEGIIENTPVIIKNENKFYYEEIWINIYSINEVVAKDIFEIH